MSLVSLPRMDAGRNATAHITIQPKFSLKDAIGAITYRVLIIWEDGGSGARPESVQVQLFRNNDLSETVSLDKTNDWQYSWMESDPAAVWAAAELVPEGYSAAYQQEGNTFIITNTPAADIPSEPGASQPEETTPEGPKLPQTGQLWWPVPVLALSGMILVLLGWIRRKESCDEA